MSTLFPATMSRSRRKRALTPVTIRDFSGGWNAIDDDISLATRFQVSLKNMHRTPSGASELRYGTRFFSDIKEVNDSTIKNCWYFNNRLICVSENGQVTSIDGNGAVELIWNGGIAAALPGAPSGWSSGLVYVNFVPFKNELVIHNGVDKPISVNEDFEVNYVQDTGSGSNVNVPIGRYGAVVANYHCIAGLPNFPTTIYISSSGTSGVFPGDPAPNDSISIDVGARIPDGGAEITGLAGFKNYLFVFFRGQTLIIQLGIYDDNGNHTPDYNDTLPHFGAMGYRNNVLHDNDLYFSDIDGVNSARRNLFAGLLDSVPLSDLIAPEYQAALGALTESQQKQDTFMVLDRLGSRILTCEPNGKTFVYSVSERLKYKAWSLYEGWSWQSGCTSFLGRVFFTSGTKVFKLGNKAFGELYRADRENDRDFNWENNTTYAVDDLVWDSLTEQSYKCCVSHTTPIVGTFEEARTAEPDQWELYRGEAIDFEIEFPWIDGKTPMNTKLMRYVSLYSKGTARFDLKAYVDNLYKDDLGEVIYQPAKSIEFIGNDTPGFGTQDDNIPMGGGRRSGDPRLWRFPVKFKMVKFIISGSAREALQIIAIHFLYSKGSFKR